MNLTFNFVKDIINLCYKLCFSHKNSYVTKYIKNYLLFLLQCNCKLWITLLGKLTAHYSSF